MKRFSLLCFVFMLFFSLGFAAVCGNSSCESGESFAICPADCKPKVVSVEVLEFDSAKTYMRGDTVFVKVKVTADGLPVSGANVSVVGFFGAMQLFDDGEHGDDKKYDTIFANSFVIPASATEGRKVLRISAEKMGVVGTKSVEMQLTPSFNISLRLSQTRLVLGDSIELEGHVSKKGEPFEGNIELNLVSGGATLKTIAIRSDASGFYSYSYRTSLIDPVGNWTVAAVALDEHGNRASTGQTIEVYKGIEELYYDFEFVEPISKIFNRGELVKFMVELKSPEGELVENANASIVPPNSGPIELKEILPGYYTYSYKIPYNFPLGKQTITGVASKDTNGVLLSGFASEDLIIDKAKVFVEMLQPGKKVFSSGDSINFQFRLYYFDNTPVSKASLNLKVNDLLLQTEEEGKGIYSAAYVVGEQESLEKLSLSLVVHDQSDNEGSLADEFEVMAGTGILGFLGSDLLLPFVAFILAAVLLPLAFFYFKKSSRAKGLLARKSELKILVRELGQQYYKQGKIKTAQYKELLGKYQQELDEIDALLSAEGKK